MFVNIFKRLQYCLFIITYLYLCCSCFTDTPPPSYPAQIDPNSRGNRDKNEDKDSDDEDEDEDDDEDDDEEKEKKKDNKSKDKPKDDKPDDENKDEGDQPKDDKDKPKGPSRKPWNPLDLIAESKLDTGLQTKIQAAIGEVYNNLNAIKNQNYTPAVGSSLNGIGKIKMAIIAETLNSFNLGEAKKLFEKMILNRFYIRNMHFNGMGPFRTKEIDAQKAFGFIQKINVIPNKGFENKPTDPTSDTIHLIPNFANKNIGGGRKDKHMVQEETLCVEHGLYSYVNAFSTNNRNLEKNEIAIISDVPRFLSIDFLKVDTDAKEEIKKPKYNGIEKAHGLAKTQSIYDNIANYSIAKPTVNQDRYDILCIDAPNTGEIPNYTKEAFWFAYKKLIVGLLSTIHKYGNDFEQKGKNKLILDFMWGNWGAGAFKNSIVLMYLAFLCSITFINDSLDEIKKNTFKDKLDIDIKVGIYPLKDKIAFDIAKKIFEEATKGKNKINPGEIFDDAIKYVNNNNNIYSFTDNKGNKKTILEYEVNKIPDSVKTAFNGL